MAQKDNWLSMRNFVAFDREFLAMSTLIAKIFSLGLNGDVNTSEEIEDREWDRVLSSPEGLANAERELAETMRAIATGDIIEYIPGKSLEELFQR